MYERYVELLNEKGVKNIDVSRATGIPASTFSDWKKGKSSPKREKLEKIAEFFGVNKKIVSPSQLVNKPNVFWDTRDNNLLFLANQLARTDISSEVRKEIMKEYSEEVAIRDKVDGLFKNLVSRTVGLDRWDEMMTSVSRVNNPHCYYDAVDAIDQLIPMNDYELKFFTILSNLCDATGLRSLPIN